MPIKANSALLIVDMQNDFCPGGALPVSEGDSIVPRLNAYIRLFRELGRPIVASRDWHPPQTTHFVPQGGPWPPHCIQNTAGARFHPDLAFPPDALIFSKGTGDQEDAYSAFQARDDRGRSLANRLRALGLEHLYVGGLALDYCVKATALDAIAQGLGATLLVDATRAVNVNPHDAELALEELVRAGVELATIERL
ncbi:MAG TPA: nicotinamidase [Anaerolineae bacterium]|nr:nicotinamidase [Anaerolineae bacterium]